MSKIALEGNVSGSGTLTIAAPNTNSNFTLSLPTNTGTIITQNSTPAFASTIGVGGATAAASGAGITFPATQSASSDANTLDDYEEGTFTPTVSQGITSISYGNQEGSYTKVGRLVTFLLRIRLTAGTAAASRLTFAGLPFTVSTIFGFSYFAYVNSSVINSTSTNLPNGYVSPGGTVVTFYKSDGTDFTGTNLSTAGTMDVYLYGSYIT